MSIIGILLGYLIGSLSPAYFLARLLKKTDIRKLGDGNAGATNVYKTLGTIPAVVTALFDLGKGLLVLYLCSLFHLPALVCYAGAYAAVLGHMYPFYLGFRGGQGAATATGLIFYFLYIFIFRENFPVSSLVVLGATLLAVFAITRKKEFLALVTMPVLAALVLKNLGYSVDTIAFTVILTHIFIVNIYNGIHKKLFALKESTRAKALVWRTFLRPLASVFPITYFYLTRTQELWFLGIVAGIFTVFDLVRLINRKLNVFSRDKKILKVGEEKRFSSMSLFLLASFATILIFPIEIAIPALFFLVFGDLFAKFFGLEYGQIKLVGEKTFEGSLGHLVACLIICHIIAPYFSIPIETLYAGAAVATVVEALPLGINDNFTVPLLSATTMWGIANYL